MRLFVGLFPPADVARTRAELGASLRGRPGLEKLRWVRRERLHLTLAFLGEQPAEVAVRLAADKDRLADLPRFGLELGGLGGFPDAARARVLWVGVSHGAAELGTLAARVAGATPRPFRPHLTLARAGRGTFRVPRRDVALPAFEVCEIRLVASVLGRAGGYETRATWRLGRTA